MKPKKPAPYTNMLDMVATLKTRARELDVHVRDFGVPFTGIDSADYLIMADAVLAMADMINELKFSKVSKEEK